MVFVSTRIYIYIFISLYIYIYICIVEDLLPGKLTYPMNRVKIKGNVIFHASIFRGYVSFKTVLREAMI